MSFPSCVNLKICCSETSVRKTLFCPSMVMPCGTRNVFAPHEEISLPESASISITVGSGSLEVCLRWNHAGGYMKNKHVAVHVDGNPCGFAQLYVRRKIRPILYFFIPCDGRRSGHGLSPAAEQQCPDQHKTRSDKGARYSNHIDLQYSRNKTKLQKFCARLF